MGTRILPLVCLASSAANSAAETPPIYITDLELGKTRAGRMSAQHVQEERDLADQYARATNLAVLKDGDADEMRFWLSMATFDPWSNGIATVGYVVTGESSRMCRIAYSGKSTTPKSGHCTRDAVKRERPTMGDLARLSAFADYFIGCDVQDGSWVLIDAVSNGKLKGESHSRTRDSAE